MDHAEVRARPSKGSIMRTPASIAGHPIHPMLVAIPIGLWVFSFVCDLFVLSGRTGAWPTVALYTMVGGIVGALLAAVPGFIDLLSLPAAPKSTPCTHIRSVPTAPHYFTDAGLHIKQNARYKNEEHATTVYH